MHSEYSSFTDSELKDLLAVQPNNFTAVQEGARRFIDTKGDPEARYEEGYDEGYKDGLGL